MTVGGSHWYLSFDQKGGVILKQNKMLHMPGTKNNFTFVQIKNNFRPFGDMTICLKKTNCKFSFCSCFLKYIKGRYLLIVKNILIFSCEFLEMKTFPCVRRARGRACWFFGIELQKLYLTKRNVQVF